MTQRDRTISPDLATGLVQRHLSPLLTVTDIRKHTGGQASDSGPMLELVLDREPGSILAHCVDADRVEVLKAEEQRLQHYRKQTHFAIAEPLKLIENDPAYPGAILLLEKIKGVPLSEARLSARGQQVLQNELARALAELHTHNAEQFGPAIDDAKHERWIDCFGPAAKQTLESARRLMPSSCREVLDHVATYLDHWLDHKVKPTLIHGELTPANILVDDARPDEPRLLGFLGAKAVYTDPEVELANLQLRGIVGDAFFKAYGRKHAIDQGFVRRSRVYWLIALLDDMLEHGDRSMPQCERVIDELRRLSRQ